MIDLKYYNINVYICQLFTNIMRIREMYFIFNLEILVRRSSDSCRAKFTEN